MKKCLYCKEKFTPRFKSTEKCCSIDHEIAWLSTPEGKATQQKVLKTIVKAKDKAHIKRKKNFNRRDIPHQLKLTQLAFNKMRRLQEFMWFKDKGLEPECTSCGKKNMDWCCGHMITVGSSSNLRFDINNTILQCNKYCNKSLSGNITGNKTTRGYHQGLKDRFGETQANRLIDYCEANQSKVRRYTGEELEEMRRGYNAAIRYLEANI